MLSPAILTLLNSGRLVLATTPHRTDGRHLADDVRRCLRAAGVAAAAVDRCGPYVVDVTLPPGWPPGWSLGPVLARLPGVEVRDCGRVVRVRRRPIGAAG